MIPRAEHLHYHLHGAFHRLAWWEWGPADAPAVVCVHGLTRQGRDFDRLAELLAADRRVLCPDLPGRGRSGWLPEPGCYDLPAYLSALSHLLARIGGPVDWVGTSLGGICGMALAAAGHTPIRRLVLNDIGPHVPAAGLARIREYLAPAEPFPDLAALEAHLRRVHAPFGHLPDAEWRQMAAHSARSAETGGLALHYDPAIAAAMRAGPVTDLDFDAWWRRIAMPVLAIRGASSDLLPAEVLAAMADGGARTLTVPGAGHAPALVGATAEAVAAFLLGAG